VLLPVGVNSGDNPHPIPEEEYHMKEKIEKLKAAQSLYSEKNEFSVGQIVTWKDGMRNKKNDGPFVVVEVITTPLRDPSSEAGSPYYRENLDIVLGSIDRDGDFLCFHYDSARMRPLSI
jgi:hypothetical protein